MSRLIISVIAFLGLAAAASGAVSLTLTDGDGDNIRNLNAEPVPMGTVLTLNVNLGITDADEVSGYTFFLHSSQSGAFSVFGRSNNSPILTVSPAIFFPDPLDPVNHYDLGAAAPVTGIPELDAVYAPGESPVQTVQLLAMVDITSETVISIVNAAYFDLDGRLVFPFNVTGFYTIVPEPVSALLLVLGGLFVTRRRVA